MKDHNGRDHSSHLVKQTGETGHLPVGTANFEVIGSGYHNSAYRRKITEALQSTETETNIEYPRKICPIKTFQLDTIMS